MLLPNETLEDIERRAESMMDSDLDFLEQLIEYRETRGLSQNAVAKRMGISQAAVSQFESLDGNPTMQTLRRYANAVGARVHHTVVDDLRATERANTYKLTVIPGQRKPGRVSDLSGGWSRIGNRLEVVPA